MGTIHFISGHKYLQLAMVSSFFFQADVPILLHFNKVQFRICVLYKIWSGDSQIIRVARTISYVIQGRRANKPFGSQMEIIDLLFHKQFSSSWRSAYFCFGLSSQLSSWWLIVSHIPDVFQAECRFKMILTEYKKIRAGAHWYAEEDSSGQLSSEASVRQKERDLEVKKEKNIYYGWYGLIVVFFPSSPPNRLPALVTSGDAFAFFSGRPSRVFF